jgi:hypothetical protein
MSEPHDEPAYVIHMTTKQAQLLVRVLDDWMDDGFSVDEEVLTAAEKLRNRFAALAGVPA